MQENVFEVLNEVQVDLNEYERQELSDLEKKRLKKTISKKNIVNKKLKWAVSVAVLAVTISSGAYASGKYDLLNYFMGNYKSKVELLQDYVVSNGEEMLVDGFKLKLKECVVTTEQGIGLLSIECEDTTGQGRNFATKLEESTYVMQLFKRESPMAGGGFYRQEQIGTKQMIYYSFMYTQTEEQSQVFLAITKGDHPIKPTVLGKIKIPMNNTVPYYKLTIEEGAVCTVSMFGVRMINYQNNEIPEIEVLSKQRQTLETENQQMFQGDSYGAQQYLFADGVVDLKKVGVVKIGNKEYDIKNAEYIGK